MKKDRAPCLITGCLLLPFVLCGIGYGLNYIMLSLPYFAAVEKWERTQPASYRITTESGTFGGYYDNSPVITIENGAPVNVHPDYAYNPVERLFDTARRCGQLPIDFLTCQITYDSQYGFPTVIREDDFDLGRVDRVKAFTVIESAPPP